MTTTPDAATCASCGAPLRPTATYCRECGDTNLNAALFHTPTPVVPAPAAARAAWSARAETPADAAVPLGRPRPSVAHADQAPVRRPRWILGTFWALVTIGAVFAGIVGPEKWLLLVAIATGAYSVYLYRGGRYGFFVV